MGWRFNYLPSRHFDPKNIPNKIPKHLSNCDWISRVESPKIIKFFHLNLIRKSSSFIFRFHIFRGVWLIPPYKWTYINAQPYLFGGFFHPVKITGDKGPTLQKPWHPWLSSALSAQLLVVQPRRKFYLMLLVGGFKYFLFSPGPLGKWSNLTSIFFRGVGSTTN